MARRDQQIDASNFVYSFDRKIAPFLKITASKRAPHGSEFANRRKKGVRIPPVRGFSTISPDGGGEPEGALAQALTREFGGFAAFKEQLSALALGQFGSGWAWLSAAAGGKLLLSASPNQDNPIIEGSSFVPILGIDVWEHAYYLKYKNLRADYVQAFYNVIDWKAVAANYEQVQNG